MRNSLFKAGLIEQIGYLYSEYAAWPKPHMAYKLTDAAWIFLMRMPLSRLANILLTQKGVALVTAILEHKSMEQLPELLVHPNDKLRELASERFEELKQRERWWKRLPWRWFGGRYNRKQAY